MYTVFHLIIHLLWLVPTLACMSVPKCYLGLCLLFCQPLHLGFGDGKDRILLEKLSAITLEQGKMTTARRVSAIPQVSYLLLDLFRSIVLYACSFDVSVAVLVVMAGSLKLYSV